MDLSIKCSTRHKKVEKWFTFLSTYVQVGVMQFVNPCIIIVLIFSYFRKDPSSNTCANIVDDCSKKNIMNYFDYGRLSVPAFTKFGPIKSHHGDKKKQRHNPILAYKNISKY